MEKEFIIEKNSSIIYKKENIQEKLESINVSKQI